MATNDIPLNVTDNTESISLEIGSGDPFYVGAEAKVEQLSNGAKITCKDADGTTTATVYNGERGEKGDTGATGQDGADGQDGQDGQDGISPSVSVEVIAGGHEVSITDAEGTITFDVMDGQDGQDGQDGADGQDGSDGEDGFSPSASVSKVGDTATITITDKDGTTTASISDGTIANEQDPIFVASAAYGIASSDITAWNNKSEFSGDYDDLENKPTIPSSLSDLTNDMDVSDFPNDAGYLTSFTETDPTVPSWAKAASKPSYTASEVGALPDTTVIPSSLSDLTNDMAVSDFTNDAGYLTSFTETDPTVPSWAKASTKPSYTASEVGALPDTTSIPSALSDLTNDLDVSDFPNDAGYLTQHQDISGKANKVDTDIDSSVTTLYASLGWTPPS